MCFGKTKGSDENHWMAQLEYCSTDLDHLLHGKDAALREQYTPQLMVKLIREIIAGLCYCHGMGKCHLDLKPDNILLAETPSAAGPSWTAKLADFGALVSDTPTCSTAGDEQHGGSTQTVQWLGTYLWMPPEATGLNAQKGYPKGRICAEPDKQTPDSTFGASDWFSFGIMLWEMVTRQLPNEGMGEAFQSDLVDKVWVRANSQEDRTIKHGESTSGGGQWKEDFRAVAKAYFHGSRPEIPGDCPPLLSKLMVACWQDKQQDRPTTSFMRRLSELSSDEQWLEPPGQELSYEEFLGQLGLADKKDALAEYLSNPGAELVELKQMPPEDLDEDVLNDGDLGFDEETKARFRAAVAGLNGSGGGEGDGNDEEDEKSASACAALEVAAALPAETLTVESMQKLIDTAMAAKDAAVAAAEEKVRQAEAEAAAKTQQLEEKTAATEAAHASQLLAAQEESAAKAEAETQLADVQHQLTAQWKLAAARKQSADAAHAQLQSELRERQEYTAELEAVSIAECQRLEAEVNRLQAELQESTEYVREFEEMSIAEFARVESEASQLRAQLARAGVEAQPSEGVSL
jgi:serine/threonine protein kinase